MGQILKNKGQDRAFQIVDEGTHIAICTAVVGIGPQETHFGEKEQLKIRFEIPLERVTYKDKDGIDVEGPMIVWKTYTASLNEKANLRKDLESWRSKKFTDIELDGWDIGAIVGKPCMITIVHTENSGNIYANVATVTGIPKGTIVPASENELIDFNFDDYTDDQFETLPEWLQIKVTDGQKLRDEQEARVAESKLKPDPDPTNGQEISGPTFVDDDIPF